jgi:hypothetical protein
MANLKITSFANPTITLDQIILPDRTGQEDIMRRGASATEDKTIGIYSPYLVLNGLPLGTGLTFFSLDINDRIPVLRFNYRMTTSLFLGTSYPKDGDIVSLFISSPGEIYKPIRMDFNVLSVQSTSVPVGQGQSIFQEGLEIDFSILAETRIPTLYTSRCKSFASQTSYQAIFSASQELELGFSSNDTEPNDLMTWICPNLSYWEFINNVIDHSYKDDESFFDFWIDPFYNFNFVNLGPLFNAVDVREELIMVVPGQNKFLASTYFPTAEDTPIEIPLVLTNYPGNDYFPYKILTYTLISNAGQHTNLTGYVQDLIYYDNYAEDKALDQRFVEYTIESTTISNVSDGQLLQKGRAKESIYKNERRKRWLGILDREPIGNVHSNFFHAEIQNPLNIFDATKFVLRVELDGYFPAIYKGQIVPVSIYTFEKGLKEENTGKSSDGKSNTEKSPILDVFLSGNYVLMGYEVTYTPGTGMRHVLNLCKRVWDLNTAGSLPKTYPVDFKKEQ